MREKMIEKNIELSTEFSRFLFEHPEFEKKIPLEAEIILLPEFNLELKRFNLKIGKRLEARGVKVIYVKIEKLRSRMLSRIDGVKLETVAVS